MKFINKIKDFKTLCSNVKKENLDSIMLDFENLNKKAETIFDEVSTDKDFSLYRLELLEKQLLSIEEMKEKCYNSYFKYGKDLKEFNYNVFWISLILILISFILLILTSILFYIPGVIIFNVLSNYRFKLVREYEGTKENYIKMNQYLKNTLISCGNFIGDKKTKKLKQIENAQNKNIYSKELLASHLISVYLETGELINASKEVMDYAVKMLQFELQSKESCISILLENAREKINAEVQSSELVRARIKNDAEN